MSSRRMSHRDRLLNEKTSCYVLITCGEPSESGEMQVEVTYQGDVALASYILQGAQTFFDQEVEV